VAAALVRSGFATVLADLLTPSEAAEDERTARLRFDIPLLADRVAVVLDWLSTSKDLPRGPVGLFGASTGAAAALIAAARRSDRVAAVVSRGGRPDLAGADLAAVRAPTLLIVGGRDETVLTLNRRAAESLQCETSLEIVPGATHLFEERGALEQVTALAIEWFRGNLVATPAR
jgi:pimeloyl-ACP methyl ester carboxylesterase